jgi:hypothetical protein
LGNYSNGVLIVLERWLFLNEDIQVAKRKKCHSFYSTIFYFTKGIYVFLDFTASSALEP